MSQPPAATPTRYLTHASVVRLTRSFPVGQAPRPLTTGRLRNRLGLADRPSSSRSVATSRSRDSDRLHNFQIHPPSFTSLTTSYDSGTTNDHASIARRDGNRGRFRAGPGCCQIQPAVWTTCGAPCQLPPRMTRSSDRAHIIRSTGVRCTPSALETGIAPGALTLRRSSRRVLRKKWRKAVLNRHRRWRSFSLQPAIMFDCPVCSKEKKSTRPAAA